jgi:predicted Zn-dependent protease
VTVQRVAVLVVSILAIAWLAVSYGNARVIRHVQIVAADRQATPAAIDSALNDARADRTLDPSNDAESLSYQSSLEIRAGRVPDALRHLDQLVKLEPDTAEAWFLIAELTQKTDPARSAAARAQLHRLDPVEAPAP